MFRSSSFQTIWKKYSLLEIKEMIDRIKSIVESLEGLNPDEIEVAEFFIVGLLNRRGVYGPMDLGKYGPTTDFDFEWSAAHEIRSALISNAARFVKSGKDFCETAREHLAQEEHIREMDESIAKRAEEANPEEPT